MIYRSNNIEKTHTQCPDWFMSGFWKYKFEVLIKVGNNQYKRAIIKKAPSQKTLDECRKGNILITKGLRSVAGNPL